MAQTVFKEAPECASQRHGDGAKWPQQLHLFHSMAFDENSCLFTHELSPIHHVFYQIKLSSLQYHLLFSRVTQVHVLRGK